MRILQVNAVYGTKSTGRIAMEMHNYFKKMGHESFVAYAIETTDDGSDKNIFRVGNVIDHKLHAVAYRIDNMQGCHSRIATIQFLKKVEKIKPDIVLTHNLHSNYLDVPFFLKRLKELNLKVVMAIHDCWFLTGGCYHYTSTGCDGWLNGCHNCSVLGKAAEKKYKINCEVMEKVHPTIIAISKWIEGEIRKSLLGSRSDIYMIYNWIDRTSFYPRKSEKVKATKEKYGIKGEKVILGVATNWGSDKGQNEMIMAAKAFPEYDIVLVGSHANKVEYPDNVIQIPFTDSKDELAELYSLADVFFNPSVQETFGLVSGEALACGTPIVVYDTTACPEFVSGNTGVIMKNKNDIVDAIKSILDKTNEIGKESIEQECVDFVKNNFDLETNMKKYIDLFEAIL